MASSPPTFSEVVSAIFGRDFDPATVHIAYFKGDPHNKDDGRWHGQRLSGNRGYLVNGPAPDQNHFFCMGLMDPDKPGRSLAHVIGHVAFWMDDIGTKTPTAKVTDWIERTGLYPTMGVETSPGNFSYFWAISRMIPADGGFDDQTVAAIRHKLKADGWGDPATQEPARYMRSGFGVNGKAKYANPVTGEPFKLQIAVFDPDARVELDRFAEAIIGPNWREEVASGAYKTSAQIAAAGMSGGGNNDRRATMNDPLVKLAAVIGLDPQPSTRAGVIDAHCPNEAAHTGGDPTGFAFINDGMSFCNHSSCQHLNSLDFRDMMVAEYDRMIVRGTLFGDLVDDPANPGQLVDSKTGESFYKTGGAFLAMESFARAPLGVDGVEAEAEALASRQNDARLIKDDERSGALRALLDRYVYVDEAEAFWDRKKGVLVSPNRLDRDEQVVAFFRKVLGGDKRASNQLIARVGLLKHVDTLAMKPYRADRVPNTDIVLVPSPGGMVEAVNTFRPTDIGFRAGMPTAYLAHLDFLYANQPDVKLYLLEYMAFRVQNPERKMSVIPLIGGAPGIGKDAQLLQPFFRLMGLHNVSELSMSKLAGDFNDFLLKPTLYMGEFSLAGRDGEKVYDRLKDFTSPNPVPVTINPKYGKTYTAEVTPCFIATANNEDSIQHTSMGDRRFFVAWSDAVPLVGAQYAKSNAPGTAAYYKALAADYDPTTPVGRANLEVLHQYLMTLPITVFDPHMAPPRNEKRHEVIVSGLSGVQRFVYELVVDGDFSKRKVLSFAEIEARCLSADNPSVRNHVYPKAIAAGLAAAGCQKIDRVRVGGGQRVQIWTGSSVVLGDGKLLAGALDAAEVATLKADPRLSVATLERETKDAAEALKTSA